MFSNKRYWIEKSAIYSPRFFNLNINIPLGILNNKIFYFNLIARGILIFFNRAKNLCFFGEEICREIKYIMLILNLAPTSVSYFIANTTLDFRNKKLYHLHILCCEQHQICLVGNKAYAITSTWISGWIFWSMTAAESENAARKRLRWINKMIKMAPAGARINHTDGPCAIFVLICIILAPNEPMNIRRGCCFCLVTHKKPTLS